jgi:hypothetical protein
LPFFDEIFSTATRQFQLDLKWHMTIIRKAWFQGRVEVQRASSIRALSMDDKNFSATSAAKQHARRLKAIGIIVLLLGIGGASLVYWMQTRSADFSDNISMTGYNRQEQRQMEILYGKSGQAIEKFFNALKQPGTQAILILAISGVIGLGCFYLSQFDDGELAE